MLSPRKQNVALDCQEDNERGKAVKFEFLDARVLFEASKCAFAIGSGASSSCQLFSLSTFLG